MTLKSYSSIEAYSLLRFFYMAGVSVGHARKRNQALTA
jgi:hypothetical protein